MAEQFEVSIPNGDVLKGWHWPAEDAKSNLNIITGMDEYAFRYDRFAKWMNEHGVNVWVLDAYGQGLNAASVEDQEKWPENAFANNVKAIHAMNQRTKKNGLPTVQMGHSMGSFMTQSLMEHFPKGTDKVILMGSNGGQAGLMKMAYGISKLLVNKKNWDLPNKTMTNLGLGGYSKAIKNARTPLDWLSYSEKNVDTYIADPWCGHENTGGFWKEFLKGMAGLWSEEMLSKISPDERILIVSGAEDPVGQNGKGVTWLAEEYKKRGVKDVTLKLYPKMRHEILLEDDWETVCNDLLKFILS